jgi:hypothetical protein
MNEELKEQAKQLRLQGASINQIAKQLKIAKSTASLWTRSITLTPKQIEGLLSREITDEQAIAHGNIFRNKRLAAQNIGRERVYKEDPLYLAGCMLYWGEGNKSKNTVTLANAEPAMLIVFRKFLAKFFQVRNEDITITINCYTDIHSFDEIKVYWLSKLKLPESCLRKSQINNRPISSKSKMNHSEYGTCYLCVCDTKIVQEIYGAIQEYGNFSNLEWLNGKDSKMNTANYIGKPVLVDKSVIDISLQDSGDSSPFFSGEICTYELSKEDELIAKITSEAETNGLGVRLWLPDTVSSADIDNNRLNVYVTEQDDGSFQVTKMHLG